MDINMKIEDINEEYVRNNFNLDEIRKELKIAEPNFDDIDVFLDGKSTVPIKEFMSNIRKYVKEIKDEDKNKNILIEVSKHWGDEAIYYTIKSYSLRLESDQEIIRRMINSLKRRLRILQGKKREDSQTRMEEIRLYRKLRKKYGKKDE